VVQGGQLPQVIRTIAIPSAEAVGIPTILVDEGLAKSRSEARRLIRQGAVEIDGQRITEDVVNINENGAILKVGKRRFLKISIAKA
jgi:tyrosyl-tRNA synthetase